MANSISPPGDPVPLPASRHFPESNSTLAVTGNSKDAFPQAQTSSVVLGVSNSLVIAQLDKVRSEVEVSHYNAMRCKALAVQYAVQAGHALLQVKAQLSKGAFREWFDSTFTAGASTVSLRTAQRYMQLASNLPELIEKLQSLSGAPRVSRPGSDMPLFEDLSIRKAIRLISDATGANQEKPRKGTTVIQTVSTNVDDELATPQPVVDAVRAFLSEISLDPCASEAHPEHIPASTCWTGQSDGLAKGKKWFGKAFVHPPQSNVLSWVRRGVKEHHLGNVEEVLFLIPAVCDAPSFRELNRFPHAFLRERLSPLTQPGVIVFLGSQKRTHEFGVTFESLADVFIPLIPASG